MEKKARKGQKGTWKMRYMCHQGTFERGIGQEVRIQDFLYYTNHSLTLTSETPCVSEHQHPGAPCAWRLWLNG